MIRRAKTKTAAAVGVLMLTLTGTALAYFLPKHARYDGSTSGQGTLHFKVRKHNVVEVWGYLPLPAGQTCQYASSQRLPYRFVQYDPTANGPWSMTVNQYHKLHTPQRRHLHLYLTGQWDDTATNGSGTVRATLWDRDGKCKTQPGGLTWQLHRTN